MVGGIRVVDRTGHRPNFVGLFFSLQFAVEEGIPSYRVTRRLCHRCSFSSIIQAIFIMKREMSCHGNQRNVLLILIATSHGFWYSMTIH